MFKKLISMSYLSLILLTMLLFRTSNKLNILTLIIMFITLLFTLYVIKKERVFCFERYYDFAIILMVFLFAVINIYKKTVSDLYVSIILLLIVGFFLNYFLKRKKTSSSFLKKPESPYKEKIQIYFDNNPKENIKQDKNKEKKEIIVSTKNSLTYHKPSCDYMKKTSKKNVKMYVSKGQAEAMGLTPCKICIK